VGPDHHQGRPAQRPHLRHQAPIPPRLHLDRHRSRPLLLRQEDQARSATGRKRTVCPGAWSPASRSIPKTGDLWLGLFGGGLARFSAGRFDHFHQLNSGLVNDVVYAVAIEGDQVWAATTAGASRYNIKDKWDIYTEQNAPMEEIWNYNVCARDGKVHLAVWGSGVLEFDLATENWKALHRPRWRDGDRSLPRRRHRPRHHHRRQLRRSDHLGLHLLRCLPLRRPPLARLLRPRRRHSPATSTTTSRGRSAHECWFCTDKGVGACMDSETDTWVAYTSMDPDRTKAKPSSNAARK
jgi:hypothetical protein